MAQAKQQRWDPASRTWLDRYQSPPMLGMAETVLHSLKRLNVGTQEADPILGRVRGKLALVPGLRDSLEIQHEYSYILGRMVLRLTGWVLRDKAPHKVVTKAMAIKVPASWWQMLKRDCLPWLARRFPVRTRDMTESFSFEQEVRVCPHGTFAWPDSHHMEFMEFRDKHGTEGVLQTGSPQDSGG